MESGVYSTIFLLQKCIIVRINKYKKEEYVVVEYPSTQEIMAEIREKEAKIAEEMALRVIKRIYV